MNENKLNIKSDLTRIMQENNICEKDLRESFVLSSGPGGQNVNKVATCVVLKHLPSGIQVKCQTSRVQALNRITARKLLVEKIIKANKLKELRLKQQKEKLRRQNRKRPKKLKESILESKRKRSELKKIRGKIKSRDLYQYL